MGAKPQKKGADGERELVEHLRRAGYSVSWGGNRTYGAVPDASGLPGVHIECKRVEQLNIARAMEQADRDAHRFRDGAPTLFHRKNKSPWLVTMQLTDWLRLYSAADRTADFFTYNTIPNLEKGRDMDKDFWEAEVPMTADTGRNIIEYFPASRKLSISKPNWKDRDGSEKRGKTVILDLAALANTPDALTILEAVVKSLKGKT